MRFINGTCVDCGNADLECECTCAVCSKLEFDCSSVAHAAVNADKAIAAKEQAAWAKDLIARVTDTMVKEGD